MVNLDISPLFLSHSLAFQQSLNGWICLPRLWIALDLLNNPFLAGVLLNLLDEPLKVLRIFRKKGLASVWKRLIDDEDFRGGCKNHDFEIWAILGSLGFEFADEMAMIKIIAIEEVRPWNARRENYIWHFFLGNVAYENLDKFEITWNYIERTHQNIFVCCSRCS